MYIYIFFSISHRLSMVELRPSSSLSTGCVVSLSEILRCGWELNPGHGEDSELLLLLTSIRAHSVCLMKLHTSNQFLEEWWICDRAGFFPLILRKRLKTTNEYLLCACYVYSGPKIAQLIKSLDLQFMYRSFWPHCRRGAFWYEP